MKKIVCVICLLVYIFILCTPIFSHLSHLYQSNLLKLDNFFYLGLDENIKSILSSSLAVSVSAAFVSLIIALPAIFFIENVKFKNKKILYLLFFIPLVLPLYVITVPWLDLLDRQINIYNNIFYAIIFLGIAHFPLVGLFLIQGIKEFKSGKKFISSLLPYIICSFILVASFALSEPATYEFVAMESYSTLTEFQLVFLQHISQKLLKFSSPILLMTLVCWLLVSFLLNNKPRVPGREIFKKPKNFSVRVKGLFISYIGLLFLIAFIIPVIRTVSKITSISGFFYVVKTSIPENINSLLLGVIVASFVSLFSCTLAYIMVIYRETFLSKLTKSIILFSLILPTPLFVISILSMFRISQQLYQRPLTIYPLFLTYFVQFTPFATIPILLGGLRKKFGIRPSYNQFYTQIKPWFWLGWLIVFFLCYSDIFFFGYLLSPPEMVNLASRGEAFLHLSLPREGYALLLNQQIILFLFILLFLPYSIKNIQGR